MTKPSFDPEKNLHDILQMETEEFFQRPDIYGEESGIKTHEQPFNFDIKPEELEAYLNNYVIGQESAVEIIATKVCTHFNRMKLENSLSEEDKLIGSIKSNILLIGPTGVGKTFIIKLIASKIGVPFVKADATKFSETGYVGGDVEDLVRELVHEADGDVTRAEYGIIYIDEIDKIAASQGSHSLDVSRSGVQRNLLKLMEDSDVNLKTPHDLASQVEAAMEAQKTGKVTRKKINTRNILFIVSGAFQGLPEIISKRMNQQAIGFEKERIPKDQNNLKSVKTEDFMQYGFESEFIGRLPIHVVLNELDVDGLYKILTNKNSSVIRSKKLDFLSYGIDIDFKLDALKILAELAFKEKTGARGLLTVFESLLIKFEKKLPSSGVKQLVVDSNLIENADEILKSLLLYDGIKQFQAEFLLNHGTYLDFTQDAISKIGEMSNTSNIAVKQICLSMFNNYHHGMRLMNLDKFTIPIEAVDNPEEYISTYIKNNFNKTKKM